MKRSSRYKSKELLRPTTTVLILCLPFLLFSQRPAQFERLGRAEGLSQSSVNCMLRDRDGFMWFGTQDGLNRYDGKSFRVFQNQPGDPRSLSNNYIVSLCEDEEGYIWIGTMTGGLNRFDKRTEEFLTFRHSSSPGSISENTVWAVIADDNGDIWAGTSKGLNRLNKKTKQFRTYLPVQGDSSSLITEMVVSLSRNRQGGILVGTVEGLCRFNPGTNQFTCFYNPYEKERKGSNIIWSVTETEENEIITGTNHGVYLLKPEQGKYSILMEAPGKKQLVSWSLSAGKPGILWVGTDQGLFRMGLNDKTKEEFLNHPAEPNSLSDNNVWCLLEDPSGFIWAGTNNGISKTRTSAAHFKILTADKDQATPLSSSKVMAVLEDRTRKIWVGTDGGGLNCISKGKNEVYTAANSGLRNNNIWALAEDNNGDIYIGNYQGGLHKLDAKSGKITAFPFNTNDPNSLSNPRVLAIHAAKDGKIWIGTRGGGLNCLDPVTGRMKVYSHSKEDPSGFPSNTVLSISEDSQGRIWAGTHEGGLAMLKPGAGKFIVSTHNDKNKFSLSNNNIWSIHFDKKDRMWLGTEGGLNYSEYPSENMRFRYFTIRDGLGSNTILCIQEDRMGNIWMSNFSGITKLDINSFDAIDPGTQQAGSFSFFHPMFYHFDTDHGLQGLEFNQGASCRGPGGMLYFGGGNGLNYFDDRDVKASSFRAPVVVTGMKIFNREVLTIPGISKLENAAARVKKEGDNYALPLKISWLNEITLTYRESVFSFEFSSLDYSNPRKNLYAYKMLNFDEDWNFIGNQSSATYTNLDPGEYTLLIRGSNSDGVWNPDETALRIRIIPPFWKRGSFIVAVSFIILALTFFFIRRLFKNQRLKSQREKELIELQLKTIKSQVDPHFAFNAINTVAGFIYSENPDTTYDYFTMFAKMIRNILEDNDKISRQLNEEIEFVRSYLILQKMRFRDKFDFTIRVDDAVPPDTLVPKMIIQSYAENAIKHGLMHRSSGGMLSIEVRRVQEELQLVIEDNGVGREKAAQLNTDSTRKGFRIMEQIIELYRKLYHTGIRQDIEDLVDEKGFAAGTRVTLTIFLLNKRAERKKFRIHQFFMKNGED